MDQSQDVGVSQFFPLTVLLCDGVYVYMVLYCAAFCVFVQCERRKEGEGMTIYIRRNVGQNINWYCSKHIVEVPTGHLSFV